MNEQIFTVMEFSGRGDAMFGGSAADCSLYTQEDGSNAFMSAADAQRRQLVKAYFPTKKEASEAGEAASQRKADIKGRAKSGMTANPDLLAQACAYALASHRANQGLVAHFRL